MSLARATSLARVSPVLAMSQRATSVPAMRTLSGKSYTEKQERLGRPVSPHVSIYAFPPVAISSVTARFTGVALTGGVGAISALSLLGADTVAIVNLLHEYPLFLGLAKAGITFPLSYHYLAGLRHAYWDANPDSLRNDLVEKTSYAVFAAAGVITAGATLL